MHVSNILSKLGMSSRTEVAAWAVRDGLAEARPDPTAVGQLATWWYQRASITLPSGNVWRPSSTGVAPTASI